MPLVKTGATSTPTAPPVQLPDGTYAHVTYYDPSGKAWPLSDVSADQWTIADGVAGLGAAPYALTSDPHPRGGARLRHVQAQPRSITWPVMVQGATHEAFIANWRALARAFTDTLRNGPGHLEVQRPNGSRRRIAVIYEGGFDTAGVAYGGITWDTAVLQLWCEDPYWIDPVARNVHREYGAGEDYLQPFPSVSSGQVLGATTVRNDGDVDVFPTWTISGPASLITFTNTTTSEEFSFDPSAVGHGALAAGETMTIQTDPVRVRYQDGSNWVGGLNWPGAVLWGLAPGDNAVTFQLDGSGVGSAVDMSYNPKYETA
jgi:hypothetical protein